MSTTERSCGQLRGGGEIAGLTWLSSCQRDGSGQPTFYMLLDTDGSLVAAHLGSGTYWSNKTPGGDHARLEDSGDLVVYDAGGNQIWHTDTAGNPGATLDLNDAGSLFLTANGTVLWSVGPY